MAKQVSRDVLNILEACTIQGNNLFLPNRVLDRKLYTDINAVLVLIGGKWTKGIKPPDGWKMKGAHLFSENPTDLLETVILTEEVTDTKKEFQFFETPRRVALQLVDMADIEPKHVICEPSAGAGAIIKAIHEVHGTRQTVQCFELMEANRKKLAQIAGVQILGNDFLEARGRYDRIVMNPPFSLQQDIDHVMHAYNLLAPKGILVSVMSPSWTFRDNKKSVEFRNFIKGGVKDEEVIDLPEGEFQSSGTMIRTCIVKLRKAA